MAAYDVTRCAACTEMLNNPRMLPCVHTFCLKCVEGLAESKKPSCPQCGRKFTVPEGGTERLPKNGFVQKLLDVKKISEAKDATCELCEESKPSQFYCVDCQQHVCEQCGAMHRKMKATSSHHLVELSGASSEDVRRQLTNLPASMCDVHPTEALKVFCHDCNEALCMLCHLDPRHSSHNCSDINKIGGDLRRRVKDDIVALSDDVDRCKIESLRLERGKADYFHSVSQLENQLSERIQQLKKMVDREGQKLLDQLASARDKKQKDADHVAKKIQRQVVALDTFSKFSDEVFNHGTASDVASIAQLLHNRANELQEFDVSAHVTKHLQPFQMSYERTDIESMLAAAPSGNIVGKLVAGKKEATAATTEKKPATAVPSTDEKSPTPPPPVPAATAAAAAAVPEELSTAAGEAPVFGVTQLNNDIIIVRHQSSQLELYDPDSLSLKRQLPVPGLGSWTYGLAASNADKCVYVSDFVNNAVHRLELPPQDSTAVSAVKWPVSGGPTGLSVNADSNLLVACSSSLKLMMYGSDGSVLMELCLPSDLAGLTHAVQVDDLFLVSHGASSGKLQRICLVKNPAADDDSGSDEASPGPGDGDEGQGQKQAQSSSRLHRILPKRHSKKTTAAAKPSESAEKKTVATMAEVVQSFGGDVGSGDGQLNGPKGLAVDSKGRILVADRDNNRVVSINSQLSKARVITTASRLQGPRCLYLDEGRHKLYVGEEQSGRLVAVHLDSAAHTPDE